MLPPKLAVVKDVFSRMPLAARLFQSEPSADEMAALFSTAATKHGRPLHLVTDKGSQFTAKSFREKVATFGTKQRFGAVGRYGSIAVIERLSSELKPFLVGAGGFTHPRTAVPLNCHHHAWSRPSA